jgi:hypothetical protein
MRGRSVSPGLRRTGIVLVLVLLAIGGVAAAIAFFTSRDQSKVAQPQGPGQTFPDQGRKHVAAGPSFQYNSNPPTSGPHAVKAIAKDDAVIDSDQLLSALELGNIVILYPGPGKPPAELKALQDDESGPLDPALLSTGNQVVLARYHGQDGIVAVAWRHLQRVNSPADPALKRFADFWLGRPAGG